MKTKVIIGIVLALFLVTFLNVTPAFAQSPSGMISYWKFDEGIGDTAFDSVDGNHGTLKVKSPGTVGPLWTTGIFDGALSFDGVDDYVDCGTSFGSISDEQALTVEAWIKTTSTGSGKHIISQAPRGQGPWILHTSIYNHPPFTEPYDPANNGRYISIFFRDAPGPSLQTFFHGSKYPINDGEWHHVAGTWDGSTDKIRLYVDGKLDTEWTVDHFTMQSTERTLVIGSQVPSVAQHAYLYNGDIDEAAVYARALASEEILQRYLNGLLEGLKTEVNGLPSDSFKIKWFTNWQKRGLSKQIEWVIKSVEYGKFTWALWQLKGIRWRIGRQIVDPSKTDLVLQIDMVISTLESLI